MTTIDENLNVVFPVATERVTTNVGGKDKHEDVVRIWAYHSPISKAVFDANFRILAATKASLESKGYQYLASVGPRIAALTLRDEGMRDAESRGKVDENGNVKDDEINAFLAEIKRLTTILCPGPNGWAMVPVEAAISSGQIDTEDYEELEAGIVFFTCQWSMAKKANRTRIAQSTASHLKASITSSPLSAYLASLPISTPAGTGAPRAASSVPS